MKVDFQSAILASTEPAIEGPETPEEAADLASPSVRWETHLIQPVEYEETLEVDDIKETVEDEDIMEAIEYEDIREADENEDTEDKMEYETTNEAIQYEDTKEPVVYEDAVKAEPEETRVEPPSKSVQSIQVQVRATVGPLRAQDVVKVRLVLTQNCLLMHELSICLTWFSGTAAFFLVCGTVHCKSQILDGFAIKLAH